MSKVIRTRAKRCLPENFFPNFLSGIARVILGNPGSSGRIHLKPAETAGAGHFPRPEASGRAGAFVSPFLAAPRTPWTTTRGKPASPSRFPRAPSAQKLKLKSKAHSQRAPRRSCRRSAYLLTHFVRIFSYGGRPAARAFYY